MKRVEKRTRSISSSTDPSGQQNGSSPIHGNMSSTALTVLSSVTKGEHSRVSAAKKLRKWSIKLFEIQPLRNTRTSDTNSAVYVPLRDLLRSAAAGKVPGFLHEPVAGGGGGPVDGESAPLMELVRRGQGALGRPAQTVLPASLTRSPTQVLPASLTRSSTQVLPAGPARPGVGPVVGSPEAILRGLELRGDSALLSPVKGAGRIGEREAGHPTLPPAGQTEG
ncbi:unnamed protein product [Rangifer tarandus platyrhynchus]|uniref:Uncharacterized protein n=1 Tax=Rangifer tarandus platyrhynchus TaxID=3082113 RepID=A0ABN8ZFH4_RANTA|nr:unnamed protein product [Rangifer tarandus platyrhynchus]